MKSLPIAAIAFLVLAAPPTALAQATYPDSANSKVEIPSVVQKCLNAAGQAVPVSSGQCANPAQILSYAPSSLPTSSVARPANTTTYTANTGWCHATSSCSSVFTFANACRANAGEIVISGIDIWSSNNPTVKLAGVLYIFNAALGTVIADDATFQIAASDFGNLTGSFIGIAFTLGSQQASGAANSGMSLAANMPARCAPGSTTLYGMVEVTNAYVPASGEVLAINLHTVGVN
jgi:hypothetical protein